MVGVVVAVVVLVALSPPGRAFIDEKRALKDGADAYLVGYPLVSMLDTYAAFSPRPSAAPWTNRFVHLRYLPDETTRQVVRPNQDTLYSLAWLDLADGPVLVTVPDMGDRYWLMPLLDAWTTVIESLGTRTGGDGAQQVLVAGPNWSGEPPPGVTVARSPTPLVWALGRIEVAGPSDIPAVARLQDAMTVTPYDGDAPGIPTSAVAVAAAPPATRPPTRTVVDAMDAPTYFAALADGLASQPIAPDDPGVVDTLSRIGIRPGEPFDWAALPPTTQRGLTDAVPRVQAGMTEAFVGGGGSTDVDGWRVPPMILGDYGTDYPVRAVVAREGLGANLPEDAIYATATADSDGAPLDGGRVYEVVVPPPPVQAFWSVTVYDADGFLVPDAAGAQSVHRDADGSAGVETRIVVSRERPADLGDAVWLRPPDGAFSLMMRLYWPQQQALDNAWPYPPVRRIG